jgi:vacuolar-type H+-ATPase subunit I/STV1
MEVAEELGADVRVIVPVRHPAEVSYSLARRDGIDVGRGLLLWYQHLVGAELASRGHTRVLVHFHALMADWRGQTDRIAAQLAIHWLVESGKAAEQIDAFLDPQLRHSDAKDKASATTKMQLPDPVEKLYRALLPAEDTDAWEIIARSSNAIANVASLFSPAIDELSNRVSRISIRLAETSKWPLNEQQLEALRRDSQTVLTRIDQTGPLVVELIRQLEAQRSEIRRVEQSSNASGQVLSAEYRAVLAKLEHADPLLAELVRQIEAQRYDTRDGTLSLVAGNLALQARLERTDPLLIELANQIEAQRKELATQGEMLRAELSGRADQIERLSSTLTSREAELQQSQSELARHRHELADTVMGANNAVANLAQELAQQKARTAELL